MAADGMSWYFQLVDRITGPAKDMTRSLSSVSESLKQADSAAGSGGGLQKAGAMIRQLFGAGAEGTFYKGASGIAGMLDKVDKIIPLDALKKIGGAMLGAAGVIGGFVMDLAGTAVTIGLAVGAALGALALAGFKFAAESADFKRNTLLGLQTMLGTSADAKDVLEELEGYAKKVGMSKDTFVGFAKGLLGAGFQRDELKPLLGALSDIQAANGGDIAKAQELMSQLTRIKSLDKVSSRELTAFGAMGLSSDKIFAALAEQRGTTLQQAKLLFDSGNLKSKDAIDAILKAVQTNLSGGKLGALGLKFEEGSITAQIQHVKDAFGDLFENVNTKPIADFLAKVTAAISGPAGERIGAAINKAFDAVTKLFGVSGDDLEATVDKIATGFEKAVDWAIQFGEETAKTYRKIEPQLATLTKEIDLLFNGPGSGGMGAGTSAWAQLSLAIGLVANQIGTLLWINDELAALPAEMLGIGTDIVNGLWEGIETGWGVMLEKFHALVDLLPASVKTVLRIQSPSKVMADLGAQTGAGFGLGLDDADMPGQMAAAMQPPRSPALSDMTIGGFASGQGGPSLVLNLTVNVEGGAGDEARAHALAEEIRDLALPPLLKAMEQFAIETGG